MSEFLVSHRYAKAFYRTGVLDEQGLTRALSVFEQIEDLFKTESIRKVLLSPVMPKDLKLQILEYTAKQADADKITLDFIRTVNEAGRVAILVGFAKVFRRFLNEKIGVVDAEVSSVVDLSDHDKRAVESFIAKQTGKKPQLTFVTNKDLLGGIFVKIGNNIIDLSLKSRLEALTRNATY